MTAPLGAVNGLTLAEARTILDAAAAEGRRLGLKPLTIVVLDAGGQLKAAERQDGCSLMREGIARGKAFGALAMGMGGRELARRAAQMGPFMNALSDLTGGLCVPVRCWCGVRMARCSGLWASRAMCRRRTKRRRWPASAPQGWCRIRGMRNRGRRPGVQPSRASAAASNSA
jgi:uncharacterized protein GlcG (DUF336 family)